MKKKSDESKLFFSQKHVVEYEPIIKCITISQNDWERIYKMVKNLPKFSKFFWSLFTFFISLAIESVRNYCLKTDSSNKEILIIWIAVSITGSLFSLLFASIQEHSENTKKEDILNEMEKIKPSNNNKEHMKLKSLKVNKEKKPQIKIIKSIYGTSDQNRDVTKIIQSLIQDNKKEEKIIVTNNTMQGDPYPGIQKTLKIKYEVNGRKKTSNFNENDPIILL